MTELDDMGVRTTAGARRSLQIEFLTDDNPLYVLPFFEEFLLRYGEEFSISRISLCAPMGKRSRRMLLQRLTALYGYFGILRIFTRLVSARTLGLLPRRRGAERYFTLAQLARAYRIPSGRVDSPNSAEFCGQMAARAPDVVVSVACPFILKMPLLKIPRLGCINIHHAPLPRYRGMMPTFWQVFHGESSVGVTIHHMDEAIDEGDGLLQEEMAIHSGETLDHLIIRSKRHGAHCMARVLRQLQAGEEIRFPLSREGSTYFTFPTSGEILDFRRKGCRVL